MVTTSYFKVIHEKKLIGVRYSNISLTDKSLNFSKTFYLPSEESKDSQNLELCDVDEFLDICKHYNLLVNEDNPQKYQGDLLTE